MDHTRHVDGRVFVYGTPRDGGANGHIALRSGDTWHPGCAVVIAGLTDGLLTCPWMGSLAHATSGRHSVVQPLLSSSYMGYGVSSLDTDAAELTRLLQALTGEHGVQRVVLVGHSTGSQDVVRLTRSLQGTPLHEVVVGVVLIGPVSDREWRVEEYGVEATDALLRQAASLRGEGRGAELMPRASDTAPITADRFHALYAAGGDDDMFSADLPPETLREKLSPCSGMPCLVVMGASDEFIPKGGPSVAERAAALCKGIGGSAAHVLVEDNHAICTEGGVAQLLGAVIPFMDRTLQVGGGQPLKTG